MMTTRMTIAIVLALAAVLAWAGHRYSRRAYHAARSAIVATALMAGPSSAGAKPIDPTLVPPTEIGMNLSTLDYWTSEEIFFDPIKTHGWLLTDTWVDLKDQLKQDANGWPIDVPAGTRLNLRTGTARAMPAPLACTVSPGWKVEDVATHAIEQDGTHFTITPKDRSAGEVMLVLTALRPGASLTELGCRPRGAPADAVFRPDFLADLKPFGILRFMDWMKANDEPPGSWAARPTWQRMSPLIKGMPVERMVELANLNHSSAWFAMPFHADDEYQRRFATYVRDHLAPGLKVYVELSNEVWNSSFPQSREATTLGKARYPGVDDTMATDYFYADRVRQTMAVWSAVFAGQQSRLVRVLSDQAAWSQRADNALGHDETWRSVDALAVAPYFGDVPNDIAGEGRQRVEGILAKTPFYINQAIGWAKANKLVASKYGVRLIAYEGGPGFTAFQPQMVKDVVDATHDERFYALYKGFLDRWRKEIGGEFVLFDSTNIGLWAHLNYTGQPWTATPKMRAVTDFIAQLPPAR